MNQAFGDRQRTFDRVAYGHPLWLLPNVLISPHMAGDSPATTIRRFALGGDQIRRFASDTPFCYMMLP